MGKGTEFDSASEMLGRCSSKVENEFGELDDPDLGEEEADPSVD